MDKESPRQFLEDNLEREVFAGITETEIESLVKGGFTSAVWLSSATLDSLKLLVPPIRPAVMAKLIATFSAAAGVGTTSAAADDGIIMQQAVVSRKFTGQVVYDMKDPTTGEARQVPSCVIVIASKYAATFAHHRKWKEGQDVELKICSTDTTSMRVVKAKVFHINPKVDFVILKFTGEELQAPDADCGPRDGMKFYGHGLSCPGGTANLYHGIIARANMVGHGHIALDRLSGKGDSGGGIFSAATGRLLGMMVGRDKDRDKSYIIPAAVLLAAAVEEPFDPDPPPSDQSM